MGDTFPPLLLLLAACSSVDGPVSPAPGSPKPASERLTSGGALLPEQACFDVSSYELTLDVDPLLRRIDGRLAMRAVATAEFSRLALDLDQRLTVGDVSGFEIADLPLPRSVDWTHEGGRIWIDFPAPVAPGARFGVVVDYGGMPRVAPRPPWDGGFTWATTEDGSPWVATTCQGAGADLWWPCKDHPSDKPDTMELRITVPEDLFCASNGVLVSDELVGGGRRTLTWQVRSPISNYNVALNIAPYTALESSFESVAGDVVPVVFYVLPEHVDEGRKALPEFIEDLQVFEQLIGPYPFRAEKYGIVETPHLGMEHQTIIAYGNGFKGDDDGYDWLHNHEASHEWWANLVTCRDWKDMWIHEGFGTYMQALFLERTRGPVAYRKEMATKGAQLVNRRPVAPAESMDSAAIYFTRDGSFDSDIYVKGAWILHTLRWLLGDEVFFEALRRMAYPDPALELVTDGSQVRFTDTREIRSIAERVSGRSLKWFFDVYLHQPALPELVVRRSKTALELAWTSPLDAPFPMPVPITVDGEPRRIELAEGRATIPFAPGAEVLVDPDRRLLHADTRKLAAAAIVDP